MPVTSCAVCGGSENEDQVLLCDGEDCPNEIHLYCLQVRHTAGYIMHHSMTLTFIVGLCCLPQPPLTAIPEGEWFCPECDEVGNTTHLQDYLESHYTDREAHQGTRRLKWLQKLHKSLTDDVSCWAILVVRQLRV
jgi:hypothetical protein